MSSVAVVDYGMGNLRSVAKAIEHVGGRGWRVRVTDEPEVIAAADRVVFPGQGAARACMEALRAHRLVEPLLAAAAERPFLGICMGLQVLMAASDENGGTACLGRIDGGVRFFRDAVSDLKIPHMGWNTVRQSREHPLWAGIADAERFYFVHSYYVVPDDPAWITGETDYGIRFCSAVGRDNLFAVQFHPEKSAGNGLRLLANFLDWRP